MWFCHWPRRISSSLFACHSSTLAALDRIQTALTEQCLSECRKRSHRGGASGPRLLPPFLVTEMSLASLHESWAKRSLIYLIYGIWLPDVAYADDVVLLAMSTSALQTMLQEVEQAFAAVGLTFNLRKTNFTSTVVCEGESLELSGHVV